MYRKRTLLFNGLSIDNIKIIGIISMLIDHIAVYFSDMLPLSLYFLMRGIGRIAMPLFVYGIVQGYMHTRNLKKYIVRLSLLAVITQSIIYSFLYINKLYYPNYYTYISEPLNIVFSFVLSLILIKSLDFTKKYISGVNKYTNFFLRIISIIFVFVTYHFAKIDYDFVVPILLVNFTIFEKLKKKLSKQNLNGLLTGIELILMVIILLNYNIMEILAVFDILLLCLYNGKKSNKNSINKNTFYIFFPLHNAILYFLAMVIGG